MSGGLGFEAGPLRLGVDGVLRPHRRRRNRHGSSRTQLPRRASCRTGRRRSDADAWPPAWRSGAAGLATSGWAGLGVKLGEGNGIGVPLRRHRDIGRGCRRRADRPRRDDALFPLGNPGTAARRRVRPLRRVGAAPGRCWSSTRATATGRASSRSAPPPRAAREGGRRDGGEARPPRSPPTVPPRNGCCGCRRHGRRRCSTTSGRWIRHTAAVGTVERSVFAVSDAVTTSSASLAASASSSGSSSAGPRWDRRLVVGHRPDSRLTRARQGGLPGLTATVSSRNRRPRRAYLVRNHTIRRITKEEAMEFMKRAGADLARTGHDRRPELGDRGPLRHQRRRGDPRVRHGLPMSCTSSSGSRPRGCCRDCSGSLRLSAHRAHPTGV